MKEILKKSAAVPVIAVSCLALGACLHSENESSEPMMTEPEVPLQVPTRTPLATALHHPEKVAPTLSGDEDAGHYAVEQLLGDLGDDSVMKDDLALEDDSHALEIDGGMVRQGRGGSVEEDEPSLADDADNEFTMGDAPVEIAGFSGSSHNRFIESLDEYHLVVVYTDRSGDADTDYVDFGYWFLDYAGGDHIGYFTHTFARGSNPSGDISAVTGSADYAGAATGLFAKKAGGTPISSGHFTAEAMLTANFDDGMISGTVSNFVDAAGDAIDPDWEVSLDSAGLDQATGRIDESDGRASTTGGGNWRAEFYGDASAGAPGTVAGTFDAHFDNGHVGGAFAAHLDPSEVR